VKIDQSVRQHKNSESKNLENLNQEDLIEIISSVDSLTEMQSVRENLISSSTNSSQQVRIDQIASLHATENTLVVSANDNDDDDELSVLMSDSKSNEIINHQTDNRLISEENNSLILNYSRSKIRHDYKQVHQRDFVKATKIESIESVSEHDLIISKTFEQIINDSQAKE
jgi:hypothetical protein